METGGRLARMLERRWWAKPPHHGPGGRGRAGRFYRPARGPPPVAKRLAVVLAAAGRTYEAVAARIGRAPGRSGTGGCGPGSGSSWTGVSSWPGGETVPIISTLCPPAAGTTAAGAGPSLGG